MGDWISNLIEDYKYVDGKHFGERKHWLHDDYVKFIRLSESLIERNGEGVLGFITNHGYLDNPTFRGMRWHLLNTFDRIHVLDLHGNAKKKEVTPEGKPDKNVFDIQQGVAIIIAVKTGKKKKGEAEVWHGDLWGTREAKNTVLEKGQIGKPIAEKIECSAPKYAFARQDDMLRAVYGNGFGLAEFMPENSVGIVTGKDYVNISFSASDTSEKLNLLKTLSDSDARRYFKLKNKDARDWTLPTARADAVACEKTGVLTDLTYRPFDQRFTFYTGNSRGLYASPQKRLMRHMLEKGNMCFVSVSRQPLNTPAGYIFASNRMIVNGTIRSDSVSIDSIFPLYLYPDEQDLEKSRRVNFEQKLYRKLRELADHPAHGKPDEVQVFDYIYGVLHSPAYRETYRAFLKIDFPRIPWPPSPDEFWDVSAKGAELRKLHLMEPTSIGVHTYPFTGDGDNKVDKPRFEDGHIWITESQYLSDAPTVSWDFYIGGYQPAQKWLKDRKGRALSFEDVKHYQRILKILSETFRIMRTIEMSLT